MDSNLSMSLGAGLVTLIDLTNAYSMIVNGGNDIRIHLVADVWANDDVRRLLMRK